MFKKVKKRVQILYNYNLPYSCFNKTNSIVSHQPFLGRQDFYNCKTQKPRFWSTYGGNSLLFGKNFGERIHTYRPLTAIQISWRKI